MNHKLSSMIYFFLKKIPYLNKTEIVKLCYLTDYSFHKYFDRDISGIEYRYYHHGPFSPSIYSCMDELEQDNILIQEEKKSLNRDRKYYTFKIAKGVDLKKYLSKQELFILNYVLNKYGKLGYEKLTNISYKTEPMQNAKKGEKLNFAYIDKKVEAKITEVKNTEGSLREYKDESPEFKENEDLIEYQYKVMSN